MEDHKFDPLLLHRHDTIQYPLLNRFNGTVPQQESSEASTATNRFIQHTYNEFVTGDILNKYPIRYDLHEAVGTPVETDANNLTKSENILRETFAHETQSYNLSKANSKLDLSWFSFGKEHYELVSDVVNKNTITSTASLRKESVQKLEQGRGNPNDNYSQMQQRINGSLVLANSTVDNNPTIKSSESQLKRQKNKNGKSDDKKKRTPKQMSSKERKKKRLFYLDRKAEIQYDKYLPLHELWKQYIYDLFLESNFESMTTSDTLLKADFHGCILSVIQSKVPSLVGTEGIVIQETENTFNILTQKNKLKLIPKQGSIFSCNLEIEKTFTVTIYGDNFCYRAAERAARKFKRKDNIDL
jgi:ribonuclease P protein subunit POP4